MTSLITGFSAVTAAIKVDIWHNVDNNPHLINIALPAACTHMLQHENYQLFICDDEDYTFGEVEDGR